MQGPKCAYRVWSRSCVIHSAVFFAVFSMAAPLQASGPMRDTVVLPLTTIKGLDILGKPKPANDAACAKRFSGEFKDPASVRYEIDGLSRSAWATVNKHIYELTWIPHGDEQAFVAHPKSKTDPLYGVIFTLDAQSKHPSIRLLLTLDKTRNCSIESKR